MYSTSIPKSCTLSTEIPSFMELKDSFVFTKSPEVITVCYMSEHYNQRKHSCSTWMNTKLLLALVSTVILGSVTHSSIHLILSECSSTSPLTIWRITLAAVPTWAEGLALTYSGNRSICNRVASQNKITLWTTPMFFYDNSVFFPKSVEITVTNL